MSAHALAMCYYHDRYDCRKDTPEMIAAIKKQEEERKAECERMKKLEHQEKIRKETEILLGDPGYLDLLRHQHANMEKLWADRVDSTVRRELFLRHLNERKTYIKQVENPDLPVMVSEECKSLYA